MPGETRTSESLFDETLIANGSLIEGYTDGFASGSRGVMSTLLLVDVNTMKQVNQSPYCDGFNRSFLDSLYERLGLDPQRPNTIRKTEHDSGGEMHERIFRVGGVDITEELSSGPTPASGGVFSIFRVMVEKTKYL